MDVRKMGQFKTNRAIAFAILILGVASLALSAFYNSSISAIIGLGLTFWGTILLYISPLKYVPVDLLNAMATSTLANLEKTIVGSNLTGRGVYLPPRYLKDFESSLIFISPGEQQSLPSMEEIDEDRLYQEKPGGICLTPPGLALSKLLEKKLGTSFTRTDLATVQQKLPKLLTEDLEIGESVEVKREEDTVTVEISNHVFNEVCQEAGRLPRIRASVGCPLSSAIACALAKAAAKPVNIEKEEQINNMKTTRIQYRILEG